MRDESPLVAGHPPAGLPLAPAPLGESLGLIALTGSVAVHATFLLGLFVLQPAETPGTAGENVIEVSVVAEPSTASDSAAFIVPRPDEPAAPVFPALAQSDHGDAADAAPAAETSATAAPPEATAFQLALAPPEEPDGLALPAPLPPAPDASPAAPSPNPANAEQAPARPVPETRAKKSADPTPHADMTRQAATAKRQAERKPRGETGQEEAQRSRTAAQSANRPPQPRREASLATAQNLPDSPPPAGLDIAAFRAAVAQRVAGMKRYPPGARDRGEQGKPVVAFMLDRSGRLTSVAVATSSGHAELDAETISMVRRAAPFPAPPPGAPLAFSLGVAFQLD